MKRLLLLIPVIVIIGCGLFGGEDFFPLKVGNIWNYDGTVKEDTTTVGTVTMKTELTGTDQISGKDVFVSVMNMTMIVINPADTFNFIDTSYVKETNDTILSYSSKTDSTPEIAALLPFENDKTWTQIIGDDTVKYTVLPQEDVTVPAKTYKNCWKVKSVENSGTPAYSWYADGTGLIKQSFEEISGSTTYKYLLELTSATIK
jgi:hypothetical protein